jgi:hypothetical protein
MTCPDYYRLNPSDGREFYEFYHEECAPLVRDKLNDSEKHALQSACEHLFRRGLKDDETQDITKFRWWLSLCITAFQPDDSGFEFADYCDLIEKTVTPVLALVELRRLQKIGEWAEVGPITKYETTKTAWGPVETES